MATTSNPVVRADEKERVPFGVAIALGTVFALIYAFYVETP